MRHGRYARFTRRHTGLARSESTMDMPRYTATTPPDASTLMQEPGEHDDPRPERHGYGPDYWAFLACAAATIAIPAIMVRSLIRSRG
jgi:hypothetical protein